MGLELLDAFKTLSNLYNLGTMLGILSPGSLPPYHLCPSIRQPTESEGGKYIALKIQIIGGANNL